MQKSIYPYLTDPRTYSDFDRRCVKVPSWQTFDDKTQFMTLRLFAEKDRQLLNFKGDLDLYTKQFPLGNVIWPFFRTLYADNFKDFVEEIKKRKLYLFDVWGHVPGTETDPGMRGGSHFIPPSGCVEYLEEALGEFFLGIDNGEQDGRYIGLYAAQCCAASDRQKAYLNFHRFFEVMGNDLGNKLSALISLTFGHYFLKEGNTMLLGAETAQGLISSQIFYSFIRGAGKQYGVLWFGNASVWSRWGYKNYSVEKDQKYEDPSSGDSYSMGPWCGTSLSLLRRLLYSHYLYNCAIIGFEQSWMLGENTEKRILCEPVPLEYAPETRVLSPIGKIQAGAVKFVDKYGVPGVMYAPLGLLFDFYSGWTVPRHLYVEKLYQVWGNVPYSHGDYLSHNVFSLVYPGYEDSSYYRDERGYMSPTPFGDIAEVIFSDAHLQSLSKYSTIIISTDISASQELKDKLQRFIESGKRVVISAGNLLKFKDGLCGVMVNEQILQVQKSQAVTVHEQTVQEDYNFNIRSLSTDNCDVIADCAGIPLVVEKHYGKGIMTVVLSDYGLAQDAVENSGDGSFNGRTLEQPLVNPYPLLKHVKMVFESILEELKLFDVSNTELCFIVCRRDKLNYRIGIFNNSLNPQSFKINSFIGQIEKIKELEINDNEHHEPGYLPAGFSVEAICSDTNSVISGMNVRLFDITLRDEQLHLLPSPTPLEASGKLYLSVQNDRTLKEQILLRETFFEHFCGIKVDWKYFADKAVEFTKEEALWLKRQKVDIIVDFSSNMNFYPDLTLVDNIKTRYEHTLTKISHVFDLMAHCNASNALFSLHRKPQNRMTDELISQRLAENVRQLCDMAMDKGINIHLQCHPYKYYGYLQQMSDFINHLNIENLYLAVNTSHTIMMEKETPAIIPSNAKLNLLLISSPIRDIHCQMYDVHLPVSSGSFSEEIKKLIASVGTDAKVVLDGCYKNQDEEYADIKWVNTQTLNSGF